MDARKALFGVAVIAILSACSEGKSPNNVLDTFDSKACAGEAIQGSYIVDWEDGHVTVESEANDEAFKENFIRPRLNEIKRAGYNRRIKLENPVVVGEQSVSEASVDQWGLTKVEASYLWNLGFKGQNVVVGVVDTPVDITHVQLADQILVNSGEIPNNGIDDDHNGYVDDYTGAFFTGTSSNNPNVNGHGTHVSGIIAATPKKGTLSGVAPEARIVPAPFLAGKEGSGDLGNAIRAMDYAVSRGAKIINASWGGAICDGALANAFSRISAKGVLIIVASGNSYTDLDRSPSYPASFLFPNQITVAASDINDYMPSWSNSGFTAVQVAAPGEHILSTTPSNTMSYMDGTSMATPFVSGTAAALWSARPAATASQIKQAILRSVDVTPGHEFRVSTQGRINLRRAYAELIKLVP